MKLNRLLNKPLIVLFTAIGISVQVASAQAPQGLNYQAIARNNAGALLPNQPIGLRLTVTDVTNTTVYYEETQSATTNQFGLFTINLGSGTVVSGNFSTISWGTITPYLKVEMDPSGGNSYSPMGTSQLLSVPYALYAASGNQGNPGINGATWYTGTGAPLNGIGVIGDLYLNVATGDYYKKTGASIWTKQGTITVQGGGGTLDSAYNFGGPGAGRSIIANNGSVSITSSTASGVALSASTSANGVAIAASSTLAGSAYPTIQATSASNTNGVAAVIGDVTGGGDGVAGQVEASGKTGAVPVLGNNLRTTGGSGVEGDGFNGMDGEAYNAQGFGVFGENNVPASGNFNTNVLSAGLNGIGFVGGLGQTQTDSGVGLLGINIGPTRNGSTDNEGVEGQGFIGVVGKTNTPGSFLAGDGAGLGSYGDLVVIGNSVVTGTKSFVIDDPLDPSNKFLRHFCVESNEILNIYRGSVQLDANGEATVELPAYFDAINTNFTYQLTAIGQPGPSLYVKSEIVNNKFVIAGGSATQKVCWTVTAERNDVYLQQHPEARVNEVAKGKLAGKYMQPLQYGGTEKNGIIAPPQVHSIIAPTESKAGARKTLNMTGSESK